MLHTANTDVHFKELGDGMDVYLHEKEGGRVFKYTAVQMLDFVLRTIAIQLGIV